MNCDRKCHKPACAGRACGQAVTTSHTFAVALRDIYRAMQRGAVAPATISALETLRQALPQRIGPQRTLIEALIQSGRLRRAEKCLGEALLARPNHRRLTLLRAKCLILSCDFQSAIAELHRWLPQRPWDVEAHELAGEAAALADQHDLAAGHFAMACAYSADRMKRRAHLARAHTEAGKLDDAQQWMIDLAEPCPRLEGLLAAKRGELINSSDLLYKTVVESKNSFQRQLALVELLTVRRRLGYPHALRQAVALAQPHETLALAFAGEALISLGAHREALMTAYRIRRRAPRHRLAGPLATVASAMCNRTRSSIRAIVDQDEQRVPIDAAYTGRLWREALLNRIVAQQRDPRPGQRAAQSLLLRPVLARAVHVFEDKLRATQRAGHEAEVARLHQQRAECLVALGRPAEAIAGVIAA